MGRFRLDIVLCTIYTLWNGDFGTEVPAGNRSFVQRPGTTSKKKITRFGRRITFVCFLPYLPSYFPFFFPTVLDKNTVPFRTVLSGFRFGALPDRGTRTHSGAGTLRSHPRDQPAVFLPNAVAEYAKSAVWIPRTFDCRFLSSRLSSRNFFPRSSAENFFRVRSKALFAVLRTFRVFTIDNTQNVNKSKDIITHFIPLYSSRVFPTALRDERIKKKIREHKSSWKNPSVQMLI